MSFTTAHNDYLDPDKHNSQPEDYGYDKILAELKKHDSGRWQYDKIDCCITGKHGDLDTCGQQGIELLEVAEEWVSARLHCGKTVAGDDACLNLPNENSLSDAIYDKIRDMYLDAACSCICGSDLHGEWTGDDWYLAETYDFRVKLYITKDGEVDAETTVSELLKEADRVTKDWDEECTLLDKMLDELAGWKDGEVDCPEGMPGPYSIWNQYKELDKE